ncbi:erythromycin esterase family protein [Embleya sp. NPDC059259]|uniref:erythromycin esterase family protein n=1 Tax=unclassified Embleya TaxID=2699296 RepID=UPI00368C2889
MKSDDFPPPHDADDPAVEPRHGPRARPISGLRPVGPLLCMAAAAAGGPAHSAASAATPTDTAASRGDPACALARFAYPLGSTVPGGSTADLEPFDTMIRGADVVGVGEATHGSSEFCTIKHRLFRHLVEHRGFRGFVFAVHWGAGVRLDAWARHGTGHLRTIMDEEFQAGSSQWNTVETRDLFRWMRTWNVRHPDDPVRVAGAGADYADPALFDTVTAYVARTRPHLLPEVQRLYRESRPAARMDETIRARLARPLADRARLRADTRRVLSLLEPCPPGTAAAEHELMLRHAAVIARNATLFAFDTTDEVEAATRYREWVMADNTLWWQRHTGTKIFLSAHNGHVAARPRVPAGGPETQGRLLREQLGARYVNAGFTFGQGSFNAVDANAPGTPWRRFDIGPAIAYAGEDVLARVSRRDWYLDTRAVPAGPAHAWLAAAHPTRNLGASWPADEYENTRLHPTYDILVHVHHISAARHR